MMSVLSFCCMRIYFVCSFIIYFLNLFTVHKMRKDTQACEIKQEINKKRGWREGNWCLLRMQFSKGGIGTDF